MYRAVTVKTNSPYDKMKQSAKTALTFEQNDGGTIHTFQYTFTNEQCTEQLE